MTRRQYWVVTSDDVWCIWRHFDVTWLQWLQFFIDCLLNVIFILVWLLLCLRVVHVYCLTWCINAVLRIAARALVTHLRVLLCLVFLKRRSILIDGEPGWGSLTERILRLLQTQSFANCISRTASSVKATALPSFTVWTQYPQLNGILKTLPRLSNLLRLHLLENHQPSGGVQIHQLKMKSKCF